MCTKPETEQTVIPALSGTWGEVVPARLTVERGFPIVTWGIRIDFGDGGHLEGEGRADCIAGILAGQGLEYYRNAIAAMQARARMIREHAAGLRRDLAPWVAGVRITEEARDVCARREPEAKGASARAMPAR